MSEVSPLSGTVFGRRAVLAGSAAVAAALMGCTAEGNGRPPEPGGTGPFTPPKRVPVAGVTPEFPAGEGIPAGFTRLPDPLVELGHTPLSGAAPITMMLQGGPPQVPFAKNGYYRQLAKAVGTEFDVTWALFAQYRDKFQVTIASDDLPDVVMIDQVPQLPKLLESKFTDLTEYLSGDKVAEYPGLASIPSAVWQVPVLDGRLWGVSRSRPAGDGVVMLARGDLLARRGITAVPELADGEDFVSLLAELTAPDRSSFAMGADPVSWLLRLLLEMHGAPNGWRAVDGTWVHANESDQMVAALEQAAAIWAKGYLHPNSASDSGSNQVWWEAGATTLYIDGVAGWTSHSTNHPDWDVSGIVMPKWEGGGDAVKHLAQAGYPYYAAIRKQSSPDRVREILRAMDLIAAPFGTREWLVANFGEEGQHYTVDNGVPVPTELRKRETFGIGYLGSQQAAQLFVPGDRTAVERQHTLLSRVLPGGESDAATGLYSETATAGGAVADRKVADAKREIILGRKPLSEWNTVVSEWRAAAGDAIRDEYSRASEAAG